MKSLLVLIFLSLTFVPGCSGIKFLSKKSIQDLYSKEFLAQVKQVKSLYRQGESARALTLLKGMDEATLNNVEKSLRRNLMGVILFSEEKYEQAIFNFDLALGDSSEDPSLTAQIHLNLASSYFKLGFYEKAYDTIKKSDYRYLMEKEGNKSFKLQYKLAKELGDEKGAIKALILYVKDAKTISALKGENYFSELTQRFFNLDNRERLRVLEEFEDSKFISVGFLGYLESEKLYYSGRKEEAKDLLSWIKSKYSEFQDLTTLISNFNFRIENYVKIEPDSIGVVLPLSGPKKKFGLRAFRGIDAAVKELNKKLGRKINLIVRDSQGSGVVGSHLVKELIEQHHVSAIIGGLFGNEAEKEYFESKKHGVLFLSLSEVYLSKIDKDHLLVEIPGSVESQIEILFSQKITEGLGKRVAILYPNSKRGMSYLEEFWRKSRENNAVVTNVIPFEKNSTDYREPVKNLLGLKHTRVRLEEYDLLKEIHSLEKKSQIRRVQTLRPDIDFDWVFIPAFPKDALQLIPAFSYFDAFNLNLIGGPSWRSNSLSRESFKLGKLFFLGEDVKKVDKNFVAKFYREYKSKPRIIELRAFDAINILADLIFSSEFQSRDELDVFIRSVKDVNGMTGSWSLTDGVWLKRMSTLSLHRGKIRDAYFEPKEVEKTE